jgi:hypothetical protein
MSDDYDMDIDEEYSDYRRRKMHAADPERSNRLARMLELLKAHPRGATTLDLARWSDSCAVGTDISELRQSGYFIDCICEGKNRNGRKVYRYTLKGRAK